MTAIYAGGRARAQTRPRDHQSYRQRHAATRLGRMFRHDSVGWGFATSLRLDYRRHYLRDNDGGSRRARDARRFDRPPRKGVWLEPRDDLAGSLHQSPPIWSVRTICSGDHGARWDAADDG